MSVQVKISVATIVNKDGLFLMVGEHTDDGYRYNQPAGHLEPGETPQQAAIRETKEETGYDIELTGFVGAYIMQREDNGASYLRLCFAGEIINDDINNEAGTPGHDIDAVTWFSVSDIESVENSSSYGLRNPMVLKCILDSMNRTMPIDAVKMFNI